MWENKRERNEGMRKIHVLFCLAIFFLFVAFTAAGASPLQTQTVTVGPYQLLLSFYSLPRVGQQLRLTIGPQKTGTTLQFSQALLKPGPHTDGNVIAVTISPTGDVPGTYNVNLTPPVRGEWMLHLNVTGSSGSFTGNIPLNVQGPPPMPTWLGWTIGMIPLPLLVWFIWWQILRRKTQREYIEQAMPQS
jgi:hypothetical protein